MRTALLGAVLALSVLPTFLPVSTHAGNAAPADRSRTFLFTYDTKVKDLPAGKQARIWILLPWSNPEQDARVETVNLPTGAKSTTVTEKEYGNHILYVEGKANDAGEIPIQAVFRVKRREVRTSGPHATLVKVAPEEHIDRYLKPDAKVPIGGKPLELIKDKQVPSDQFAAAKLLYDVVNKHMTYSKKGTGWGQGDAVWACESKYGNCTDFHSLFISLARSEKIPAKFVMGFAIPAKQGSGAIAGYHCWAWFHPQGKGWIPVDISEANQEPSRQEYYFGNLTENRVQFSTGRDITLEPRQDGPPLNFFIYPYVEVDGQPYPAEKIQRQFSYRDLPAPAAE
jgi:transglutaminase-like putative cysteine protease